MSIEPRKGVGVVIGRFQVADLHEGHHAVISEARKHHKLCIFVGVSPAQSNTKSDPLDYPAREQMVKEVYPCAQVFELLDQYTDDGWSASLDARLGALYPHDKVTMYGGRDSFKGHYTGKHTAVEIDSVAHLSGTDMRAIDGSTVENHPSFRRGLIYAAYNKWPPIYPCVDIACTRVTDGQTHVLVGKRSDEGGVSRFPGGHVDPSDANDSGAAVRELSEETGVECGPMQYVWGGAIKSWRDREGGGVWRTTLFHAEYIHGPARAADDLHSLRWIPVGELLTLKWADDHEALARKLVTYLKTPPLSLSQQPTNSEHQQ